MTQPDANLKTQNIETATFGAGCFWGVEETFDQTPGVVETMVGYSGGHLENPTYEQVCTHNTGHTEVVQVKFDPQKVSYKDLLHIFWQTHNPTQINRQGPDIGYQYRSVIFYHTEEQRIIAETAKQKLTDSNKFDSPIATEIELAKPFYPAESYHQKYYKKKLTGLLK